MKNKRKVFIILATLLLAGCSRSGADDIIDKELQDTADNDIYKEEAEKNVQEDMEGWVNEGEEQQYIWGTWTVTGKWNGGWSEESYRMGGTYKLTPDSCFYEDETTTCSAKLRGYYIEVAGEHGAHWYSYKLPGDYCLKIEFKLRGSSPDETIMFHTLYLVERDVMAGVDGPILYRLEKTEDYNGRLEEGIYGI
ncbi:MAG: hypothetical protein K2P64_08535 [Lachnospiraceae bacterium]|nr:hypothetical protein [Lachnospiraceae bacterium]